MSQEAFRDEIDRVIADTKALKNIKPSLSDEQIEVMHELVTAQHWAGYAYGYKDAKEGNPNITGMLASIS
jgi:hypothetical protein